MAKLNVEVIENVLIGGVTYVKSEEEAEVGDYIRFESDEYGRMTSGGYYEVTDVDSSDDAHVIGDDGDDFDTCGDQFTVYKAEKSAVTSAVTPHEVKRQANAGERIKIVNATLPSGNYVNGDVLTVKSVSRGKVDETDHVLADVNGRTNRVILDSEYVVLEYVSSSPVKSPEKAQPPALKVGEYVKYVNSDGHIEKGAILRITEDDGTATAPYCLAFVDPDNEREPWADRGDIIRATDAEVAEASVTAKWAAIERKVGEFRKGDVVRSKGVCSGHTKGTVGIVAQADETDRPLVDARHDDGRQLALWTRCELIAPVESLFSV